MAKKKVIIAGAGGRDFHNFLTYFKDNKAYQVVCFTATQIPGIAKRSYPKSLAGKLYRKDIPIYPEKQLVSLIRKHKVDCVYLSYSDLSSTYVMQFAQRVLAAGANFSLLGTKATQSRSKKKIVSVTAVRTGCGKSQTTRALAEIFRQRGKRVVAIRHPMPYGDLRKQEVQRFAAVSDLAKYKATIEEEEEYLPWIEAGFAIYAGVDYTKILREAEKEADIILWDGGNNDWGFYEADLNIVVVDPHRAGHELHYYPGFVNFISADIVVINKVDSASKKDIATVRAHVKDFNPKAKVVLARSELFVDDPKALRGKRVLCVGDGPTLTHGGMAFGAATLAAKQYGAHSLVDPKKCAVGSILATCKAFPHIVKELPAMGYGKKQVQELAKTIRAAHCDVVLDGTPADLRRLLNVNVPVVTVDYALGEDAVKQLSKLVRRL